MDTNIAGSSGNTSGKKAEEEQMNIEGSSEIPGNIQQFVPKVDQLSSSSSRASSSSPIGHKKHRSESTSSTGDSDAEAWKELNSKEFYHALVDVNLTNLLFFLNKFTEEMAKTIVGRINKNMYDGHDFQVEPKKRILMNILTSMADPVEALILATTLIGEEMKKYGRFPTLKIVAILKELDSEQANSADPENEVFLNRAKSALEAIITSMDFPKPQELGPVVSNYAYPVAMVHERPRLLGVIDELIDDLNGYDVDVSIYNGIMRTRPDSLEAYNLMIEHELSTDMMVAVVVELALKEVNSFIKLDRAVLDISLSQDQSDNFRNLRTDLAYAISTGLEPNEMILLVRNYLNFNPAFVVGLKNNKANVCGNTDGVHRIGGWLMLFQLRKLVLGATFEEVKQYSFHSPMVIKGIVDMLADFIRALPLSTPEGDLDRIRYARDWFNHFEGAPLPSTMWFSSDVFHLLKQWVAKGFNIALFRDHTKVLEFLSLTDGPTNSSRMSKVDIVRITQSYICATLDHHFYIVDGPSTKAVILDSLFKEIATQLVASISKVYAGLINFINNPQVDLMLQSQHLVRESTEAVFECEYVLITNVPIRYKDTKDILNLTEELTTIVEGADLTVDLEDLQDRVSQKNFLFLTAFGTSGCAIVKLSNRVQVGLGDCSQKNVIYSFDVKARNVNTSSYVQGWKAYLTCLKMGTESWVRTPSILCVTGSGAYRQAEQEAGRIILSAALKDQDIGETLVFPVQYQHKISQSDYKTDPIFVVVMQDIPKEESKTSILCRMLSIGSWNEGSILKIHGWAFQLHIDIGKFSTADPDLDTLLARKRHITLDGFIPLIPRQLVLALVVLYVDPKVIEYIYMRNSKRKSAFIMSVTDEYVSPDWDKVFLSKHLVNVLATSDDELRPGLKDVQWYKFIADNRAIAKARLNNPVGGRGFSGRGPAQSGRGVGRGGHSSTIRVNNQSYKDTVAQAKQSAVRVPKDPHPFIHK